MHLFSKKQRVGYAKISRVKNNFDGNCAGLHLVGNCPVCGYLNLVALKSSESPKLFFYCHACGCAWDNIPDGVGEINDINVFASVEILAATRQDLCSAGIDILGCEDDLTVLNEINSDLLA